MNIEEIDKWLDNEYGTSYTRLGELHDYFFEKYTDQKEEIERQKEVINRMIDNEEKYCLENNRLNNIIKQQDTRNSRQRIANRKLLERNQDLVIKNLKLNNIINEINSIIEYWGYDNDISSFKMAMKNIKDILDRK